MNLIWGCQSLLGWVYCWVSKNKRGKLELGLKTQGLEPSQNFQQKPILIPFHDLGFTIKIVFFLLLALCLWLVLCSSHFFLSKKQTCIVQIFFMVFVLQTHIS
jgi:hypothetical protein